MANILEKLLRFGEGRTLKRLRNYATAINNLSDEYSDMTDAQLREETDRYKARVADGESLDKLLPRLSQLSAKPPHARSDCATSMCS